MCALPEISSPQSVPPRVNFPEPYYARQLRIISWSYLTSLALHGVIFFILWFFGFLMSPASGGIIIRAFPEAPPGQVLYERRKDQEDERISKFFRIDFLPALDINRVRWVEPEEETPPPEEPRPEPPPEPVVPEPVIEEDEGVPEYVKPGVKTYSVEDESVDYIVFPDIELTDVFGEPFSAWRLFGSWEEGGRTAVIVFCDVSREQGYNDLTHWADMWVKFLGVRGLGGLPHVICIGNIIEDPYIHPIEYYETALKFVFADYRDQIQYYTQSFEVTGVIDVHGEILRALSDELGENVMDLQKPILMLVDNWGVIRVMMWGRPVDITLEEVDAIGGIVREIWTMTEFEYAFFKALILKMQADRRRADGLE